jgi:dihydrodipicolinate reductase
MIKVIIAGAAGRMGQRVAHMVNLHPQLKYAAAFEATGNPCIGRDAGIGAHRPNRRIGGHLVRAADCRHKIAAVQVAVIIRE